MTTPLLRITLIAFTVIILALCVAAFVYFHDLATSTQIIMGLVALLLAVLCTGAAKSLWNRRFECPNNRCTLIRVTRWRFIYIFLFSHSYPQNITNNTSTWRHLCNCFRCCDNPVADNHTWVILLHSTFRDLDCVHVLICLCKTQTKSSVIGRFAPP